MSKKKFVSKWAKVNTLELVAERIRPTAKQDSWMLDRQLKAAAGLEAIMRGTAVKDHVSDVIAAHNMVVALQRFKTGDEYRAITLASSDALVSIAERFNKFGHYGATGLEIKALQDLRELHNAQLEATCVGDVQRAYEFAINVHRSSGARKLSTSFVGAPA